MIETERKIAYKAFGLRISSEIPLPELIQTNLDAADVDIEIIIDHLVKDKIELAESPYKHVVRENNVMYYIPNTAFYCVREGRTIAVSPMDDADEDLIRLYILGTCMSALLMQRGIYPLHGSAVAIHGRAYAFVGESGAGKSTLASAFMSQGYPLLSDDLIAVSLSEDDQSAYVIPSFPQQKLWQESLDQFGMTTSDYRSIYGRETKYSVPVTANYYADPLPLAAVIELVKTEEHQVGILRITKLNRLQTLYCHTFRQFLIPRLGLMDWHFATSAAIVNQIDMFQLHRPANGFTTPQLVSLILNTIETHGFFKEE